MNSHLSHATLADADRLATLINAAYRGDTSRQGWTTEADFLDGTRTDSLAIGEILQQQDTIIIKYEEEGALLGCMELRKENSRLYLGMLTVQPSLQGKGIGKVLLQTADEECKRQGCTSIFMTVISIRTELIEWYTRHGFRLTGERKSFAFNDERFGIPRQPLEFVVMEKIVN